MGMESPTRPESPYLQLIRFGLVGALNTAFAYGVFAALLWTGLHFTLATLLGGAIGVVTGFRLHGKFVFKNPGKGRFLHFCGIFILIYALSVGIQAIARLGMNGYAAGAIASCFTAPISFILNRFLVFHSAGMSDKEDV